MSAASHQRPHAHLRPCPDPPEPAVVQRRTDAHRRGAEASARRLVVAVVAAGAEKVPGRHAAAPRGAPAPRGRARSSRGAAHALRLGRRRHVRQLLVEAADGAELTRALSFVTERIVPRR